MICPNCTNGFVTLLTTVDPCTQCAGTGRQEPACAVDADDVSVMFLAYVEAALWSTNDESTDDGGEPLDCTYGADDLHPDTAASMRATCEAFADAHADDIEQYNGGSGGGWEQAGIDLWMTQNGHGCGFWARGGEWWPEDGQPLSVAAGLLPEVNLYIGDDGAIHAQ
jgi:hypothetical protein